MLEKDGARALAQIRAKRYAWPYQRRKYRVIAYGMAFADKDVCVVGEALENQGA